MQVLVFKLFKNYILYIYKMSIFYMINVKFVKIILIKH